MIQDGAQVSNRDGYLGTGFSAQGSVVVTGEGSSWTSTGFLYIGSFEVGAEGTGTLEIQAGGTVDADRLTVWGTGSVALNGGTLAVNEIFFGAPNPTTFVFNTGTLEVRQQDLTYRQFAPPTQVTAGKNFVVGQATILEAGATINLSGGTYYTGTFDNSAGGNFNFTAGTFGLTNEDLTVGAAGQFGSTLDIVAGQTYDINQMTVIQAGGTLNLNGGTLKTGTLDNSAGGAFNFTDGTLSAGTFVGDLVNSDGTLAPGSSPGTTMISGNYTQHANGKLAIELGGTAQGTEFDFVDVTGTATLAGTLDVTLIDAFAPTAGDSFDILDWGTLSGTFDTVNLAALDRTLRWDVSDLYITGELAVGLTGDYTGDGFVGVEDLDLLLANWGDAVNPGDYALGDGDGNGLIGSADLALV